MINYKYLALLLFIGMGIVAPDAQAQRIKRAVLASTGTPSISFGANGTRVSSTTGQPPNAGTGYGTAVILRQGYQQPLLDACNLNASFDVQAVDNGACGRSYNFTYTGDISPQTTVNWQLGTGSVPSNYVGFSTPPITYTTAGLASITLTVTNGVCSQTVSGNIDVEASVLQVQSTVVHPYCFGEKGSIKLVPQGDYEPYTIQWDNGSTSDSLGNLTPGTYIFTVTDNNGCSVSGDFELNGATQPIVIQGDVDDAMCDSTTDGSIDLVVQNGTQPVSFLWSDGYDQEDRTNLVAGTYRVTVSDAYGCSIDTLFKVRALCNLDEEDLFNDVVTDNGDGANDSWNFPIVEDFPNAEVLIYNRWGNLIWERKDQTTSWDGVNNSGEKVPVGGYFYLIKLHNTADTIYKGSITLIR